MNAPERLEAAEDTGTLENFFAPALKPLLGLEDPR
jgi:hypothetical protein